MPGSRSAPAPAPAAGPPSPASGRLGRWRRAAAGTHLAVSLTAGVLAGAAAVPALGWGTAGLLAWVVTAAAFLAGTLPLLRLDAADTHWLAAREDGSRAVRDLTLLAISVGTVATVVLVIFRAHQNPPERTALGVACLAASWLVLNTVYSLRYARLYYTDTPGGVDFPGRGDPAYRDFAYLGFTVGMTFQVSDTALETTQIRVTVVGQALMSFIFNVVILAVTVNVVAGLTT